MKNSTSFEDLSNELLCEIFDYLNAFDLFLAFTSLNERISTILKYIYLHIMVDSMYYRYQIEFLSHHLTFHSHQVISLDISDKICDQIDTIAYLFDQYNFPNLRFCTFRCHDESSKLKNVIKRLKKQTHLVSLHVFQSCDAKYDYLNRNHPHLFSEIVLFNIPLSVRCATLRFHYGCSQLITTTIINTNLTYLDLLFYGKTFDQILCYFLIPILRIQKSLRQMNVIIKHPNMSQHNTNFNIPNHLSINKNDLPTVASLKKFDLQILTKFDIHSLDVILHCMPNLNELIFTFITKISNTPFIDILFNGHIWQQILINHVPYLNKFNIHISVLTDKGLFDLKSILDSFRCFVTQYDGWHMAVTRLQPFERPIKYEEIVLHTLNYQHLVPRHEYYEITNICCSTIEMISTYSSDTNNHRFQSYINSIEFFMPRCMEGQPVQSSSNIPFQNVNSLLIYFFEKPSINSSVKNVFTLIYRYFYRIESREYIDNLSSLINLSSIVTLEFRDRNHLRQLHIVPYILLLDYDMPFIETFLTGFEKLRLMIVEFLINDLPDVPISRDYVTEKRRQSFGLNRNDEYKVNVLLGDDDLRISIP
ncbi:unnamed protein product [Rotaria sp. Silwood2]|nr:unnamed protein product [Rotaria sp. Silwood2]CAF4429811.1 unnamed protein product [Rotaria sp. Silwood2]